MVPNIDYCCHNGINYKYCIYLPGMVKAMEDQSQLRRIELEKSIPLVVKVISNGRVSIPKDIRDLLDLKEGDYLMIEIKGILKTVNHEVKHIVASTSD